MRLRKAPRATTTPESVVGYAEVIEAFSAAYASTHGGENPEITAKDGKGAKALLTLAKTPERACDVIRRAFADSWFAANTPSLVNVAAKFNAYAAASTTTTKKAGRALQPVSDDPWLRSDHGK